MSHPDEADVLAAALAESQAQLRHTGRVLHDDVGSELAAAGLRLQLLKMDHPAASGEVADVVALLDDAMEHVRVLSQKLNWCPVYRAGLPEALSGLAEQHRAGFSGTLHFACKTTVKPDVEMRVAIYDALAAALAEAVRTSGATRVSVAITGTRGITIRVSRNGPRRKASPSLRAAARLARQTNLAWQTTEDGTIVLIRYAGRRSSSG